MFEGSRLGMALGPDECMTVGAIEWIAVGFIEDMVEGVPL
jgi:hypothetical protein